jgi:flagellar capping protein FliD
MKTFLWFVVAVTFTVPLIAQTAPKHKAKAKTAPVTAEDIQALRDALAAQSGALAAQQQQIQELKQELERRDQAWQQNQQQLQQAQATAADAQSKATAAESSANNETASVAKLSGDVAEVKTNLTQSATSEQQERKRVSALEGVIGRFRFAGDIRVRDDNIFQSCPTCLDRNRARLRVRFGFDGRLNEDFIGGFYLATGSLGDSNSTNETLTNFFDRNWRNVDAILNASAFAVQATTTGVGTTNNGNVPGEGPGCASGINLALFPPCVYGPQGFTNATFTDAGKNSFPVAIPVCRFHPQ